MIQKSEYKVKYIKLYKNLQRNWMKQKLLNYEEYIDNQFYYITNNYSKAFNNAINKTINFVHPKLSILVNKLKSYLKLRMNSYY